MFNLRKISNVSIRKKWIAGVGFIILFLLPQLCLGDLYDITCESIFVFDEYCGNNPSICKIDDTHYLVQGNQPGFIFSKIRVLTVDPETGAMSAGVPVELGLASMDVTIVQIDYTHYFCVSETVEGFEAVVVTVDPDYWSVNVETGNYFANPLGGLQIYTTKINENHFLVTYQTMTAPSNSTLWAVVLSVDSNNWEITGGEPYLITDENSTRHSRLISIDETHYLCVCNSFNGEFPCRAIVLNVDLEDLTVSNDTIYDLQIDNVLTLDLIEYDDTHFILNYSIVSGGYIAYAVVLTVDPGDWSVTKENPIQIDALGLDPDLSRIDDTHYLCSYISFDGYTIGKGVVLTLDPADWTFTMETPNDQIMGVTATFPMMAKIDDAHYIVVFTYVDEIWMTYAGAAQILNVEVEIGWIEGTVSLDGGTGNVEYVIVTAGNTSTSPDATGNYSMAIQPGTYDVTATLEYYDSETVEDVVVVENQITGGIDFVLISNVGVDGETVSIIPELIGNYPNPFNPSTTISFTLNTENTEDTELVIYNLKGQKVKQLVSSQLSAGQHSVVWDGNDENGKSVTSGIYFYKMKSGNYTSTRKMILIK